MKKTGRTKKNGRKVLTEQEQETKKQVAHLFKSAYFVRLLKKDAWLKRSPQFRERINALAKYNITSREDEQELPDDVREQYFKDVDAIRRDFYIDSFLNKTPISNFVKPAKNTPPLHMGVVWSKEASQDDVIDYIKSVWAYKDKTLGKAPSFEDTARRHDTLRTRTRKEEKQIYDAVNREQRRRPDEEQKAIFGIVAKGFLNNAYKDATIARKYFKEKKRRENARRKK